MAHYVRIGEVPRKRHTQFHKPGGGFYAEQVFGTKGFSGIASILYHAHPPTEVTQYTPLGPLHLHLREIGPLRQQHLKTHHLPAQGDPVGGRVVLLANQDVTLALCRPTEPMHYYYKNGDGDDLIFVHVGQGYLETMFGPLAYGPGDYLIIPRGTIYRVVTQSEETTMLVLESNASTIEPPRRYRNEYGQLLEHAPYCERDIRVPQERAFHDEKGHFEVQVKARNFLTAYYYDFHPLDVVGWDGYLYPWALNIGDFEPITGSLHQPPPAHQTFEGHNFVVCSFVPRLLDYHPDAIPVPYNHSNLDSDEVLYYVNGNFASRRGIEIGSMTLHPSGLPHGPHPGAVEASIGKTRTEELAVMVDTFHPLRATEATTALEDETYPYSWLSHRE